MTAGQGGSFIAPSPMSINTPPQTPRSQDGSVAGSQQAGGVVGAVPQSAKREISGGGDKEKEGKGEEPQAKRRRIAPTLVSGGPK